MEDGKSWKHIFQSSGGFFMALSATLANSNVTM